MTRPPCVHERIPVEALVPCSSFQHEDGQILKMTRTTPGSVSLRVSMQSYAIVLSTITHDVMTKHPHISQLFVANTTIDSSF